MRQHEVTNSIKVGDKITPNELFDMRKANLYTKNLLERYNGILEITGESRDNQYFHISYALMYTESLPKDELKYFKKAQ